jgi:hypothetical protein
MLLGNLLRSARKKYRKISVEGICFDSRKVKKKIFFSQLKEAKLQEQNLSKKQYRKGYRQLLVIKKLNLKILRYLYL